IEAAGQHLTLSVRDINGARMIPLHSALEKLGADVQWDGDTLRVLAPVARVKIVARRFLIESVLPVTAHVTTMDDPYRVVVDLQGAKLVRKTDVDLDGTARIGQWKPEVVRVVLETESKPAIKEQTLGPDTEFDFDSSGAIGQTHKTRTEDPPNQTPPVAP